MDIYKLKEKLYTLYPAFSNVIENVYYQNADDVSIAATNGQIIYYNEEVLNKFSEGKQLFVLAHEILHVALHHIERGKDKDNFLWNIATDAVINQYLINDGLEMVDGGVKIDDALLYSSEELYDKLLEKKNSLEKVFENTKFGHDKWNSCGDSKLNNNNNGSNIKSNDNKKNDEIQNEKKVNNQSNNDKKSNDNLGSTSNLNNKENNVQNEYDERKLFKNNNSQRLEKIKERQETLSSLLPGDETFETEFKLDNIGISKPIVNWQTMLVSSMNYNIDFTYNNAEIENGVLEAKLDEIPTPITEILLDTSGSIDESLLKSFLRQCKGILANSIVRVGCFDTKFYGFKKINSVKDIDNMKFVGRGGTSFDCAVKSFSNNADNRIIFTDGYSRVTIKSPYIIWVVTENKYFRPKYGKLLFIPRSKILGK